MAWIRPLPRTVTRPVSALILLAWVGSMAAVANRTYIQPSVNLATDLARYGSAAQWRGVYYRGSKIGFTVSQVVPTDQGFELQEDGQLEMTLLGASAAARIRTTAQVDRGFNLQSFEFSLDPGTGPIRVRGQVDETGSKQAEDAGPGEDGTARLTLSIVSAGSERTETIDLAERPRLALNLSRQLAESGLVTGARHEWAIFDPATLRNAPVVVDIGPREVVRAGSIRMPAFRVDMEFAGLRTTSWITDTGEVVREESPMGLMSIRESADVATAMAVSGRVQADMLEASAVVPQMTQRIDEPRNVRRLRMRLEGADLTSLDLQGVGQTVDGDIIEIVDPQLLTGGVGDPEAFRYLRPETFIESDAPEIVAEAEQAIRGISGDRARAEALVRYVNGLLDKKPTVSLPSAREVLRTKIGDCNEHTVLFVAMARAVGIPARIAVGLAFVQSAFYYHAWPEVYLEEDANHGYWLPVDPTFNQFPADGTHLRLARGGLDQQARILPLIGRLQLTVLDLELAPGSTPILIGGSVEELPAQAMTPPPAAARAAEDCWCWWK